MAQAPGEQAKSAIGGYAPVNPLDTLIVDHYDDTGKLYLCGERKKRLCTAIVGDVWDFGCEISRPTLACSRTYPEKKRTQRGALARRDEKLPLAAAPVGAAGTAVPRQNCPIAETQLLPRSASRRSVQLKVWIKC